MRRFARIVCIFGMLAGGLVLGAPVQADDSTQQVLTLVNAQRAQHGLASLSMSPALTSAAQTYALAMAKGGFFSHTSPAGSTFISRNEAAGYTSWTYLEENLAVGQSTPQQAVKEWLASPDHRANLLAATVRETGIGLAIVAGSPYHFYWVQEFGTRPGSPASTPAPAPSGPAPALNSQTPTSAPYREPWIQSLEAKTFACCTASDLSTVVPARTFPHRTYHRQLQLLELDYL